MRSLEPSRLPYIKSAFYFSQQGKLEKVTEAGDAKGYRSERWKLTARKRSEEDSGPQLGVCSQPFAPPLPEWKLATHTFSLSLSLHAGRWLNEASQQLVEAICLSGTIYRVFPFRCLFLCLFADSPCPTPPGVCRKQHLTLLESPRLHGRDTRPSLLILGPKKR